MEQFVFLLLSVSILGITVIFGLSFSKVESSISTSSYGGTNKDFNSFLMKIKSNSSKVRC